MKKTIYIMTSGTVLHKTGRRLLLSKQQKRVFEIPCQDVERIFLYGQTEVTAQTVSTLLEMDIPLYYLRRSGRMKGKITPPLNKQVLLREQQYQLFRDPRFALPLACSLIQTKISNMQAVLEYITRKASGTSELCRPLVEARQRLEQCHSRDEIMGVEGAAAAHYFKIFGRSLPDPFPFTVRSRQPAQDPANALLNLGYMTLLREIEAHVEAHNLDPYSGILHVTQNTRPALALDLLEEFRQGIIDLFVLKLLNLKQLTPEHFQKTEENGVVLSEEGFKIFFHLYEEKMGNQDGDQPGLRKVIDEQVRSLKKCLMEQIPFTHFQISPEEEERLPEQRQVLGVHPDNADPEQGQKEGQGQKEE